MISVLVVDDSVVIRRLVTDALSQDPGITVVGTASNGRIAVAKVEQLRPDIVTLDIEMPVMNGLETLRALRPHHPKLPIIMFSTLTAAGATSTLDALAAGATDYVTKPANVGSIRESICNVRDQLIPRIYALCGPRQKARVSHLSVHGSRVERLSPLDRSQKNGSRFTAKGGGGGADSAVPVKVPRSHSDRVDIVAIGCSTGGPDALSSILRKLPKDLPVPVVVVQHMPPVFTKMFAERLDHTCALTVVEAEDMMPITPGWAYIAPGDFHFEITRCRQSVCARVRMGPQENFCRPSVDVLFRSVNELYGKSVLAVVLTGMGQDGKLGCQALSGSGAEVIVQDQETSVVWGMPGAVANAGLADAILPLRDMASHVITRVVGGRRATSAEVTR